MQSRLSRSRVLACLTLCRTARVRAPVAGRYASRVVAERPCASLHRARDESYERKRTQACALCCSPNVMPTLRGSYLVSRIGFMHPPSPPHRRTPPSEGLTLRLTAPRSNQPRCGILHAWHIPRATFKRSNGPVAQWIRHRPAEPGNAGSSPVGVIFAPHARPSSQQSHIHTVHDRTCRRIDKARKVFTGAMAQRQRV